MRFADYEDIYGISGNYGIPDISGISMVIHSLKDGSLHLSGLRGQKICQVKSRYVT